MPDPLLHLKFDGTDGQSTTVDSSPSNHTVTLTSPVVLKTNQQVLGTASAYWPVSSAGASADTHVVTVSTLTANDIFGSDFSIRLYVRFEAIIDPSAVTFLTCQSSIGQAFISFQYFKGNWSGFSSFFPGGTVQLDDRLVFYWNSTPGIGSTNRIIRSTTDWIPVIDTWYKVAVQRVGSTWSFFVDDVQLGTSITFAEAIFSSTQPVKIGRDDGGSPRVRFQGWIDDYLIYPGATPQFLIENTPVDGTSFCPFVSQGQARKMIEEVTGLDHLEGEAVNVQADGLPLLESDGSLKSFTVTSGEITLDEKAAVIHAGLPYEGKIKLLKPSDGGAPGIGQMKMRRTYLAGMRVHRTIPKFKIGLDEDHLDYVSLDDPSLPLTTGDLEKLPDTTWSKDQQIEILVDLPVPVMILFVLLASEVERP